MAKVEISEHVRETHLSASLLSEVIRQSEKRYQLLQKTIEETETKNRKLSPKELEFRFTECARLENIATLQQKMNEYRASSLRKSFDELDAETLKSNNSQILGRFLTAAGQFRPHFRWQAHHLICSRHASHSGSRLILFTLGFGINDPYNGCWLPVVHKDARGTIYPNAVGHRFIHTKKYAMFVNFRIMTAVDHLEIEARLSSIRVLLQDATNLDKSILTRKGKADLGVI